MTDLGVRVLVPLTSVLSGRWSGHLDKNLADARRPLRWERVRREQGRGWVGHWLQIHASLSEKTLAF